LTGPAIVHRLHQIGLALVARTAPDIDPNLFPTDSAWRLFQDLHPHDQRHLITVRQRADEAGLPEPLCQAALLHDIGKVTLCGTRISLVARILHVILQRISPGIERLLTGARLPLLGTGLWLANHHGRIGAERLRALGVPCVVCHVVEVHDHEDQFDSNIRLLQEIDSATP
jgi:hypothetical protein